MNGKTEQCLRYPDHVAWKNDGTLDQCARDVLLKTNWLTLTFQANVKTFFINFNW